MLQWLRTNFLAGRALKAHRTGPCPGPARLSRNRQWWFSGADGRGRGSSVRRAPKISLSWGSVSPGGTARGAGSAGRGAGLRTSERRPAPGRRWSQAPERAPCRGSAWRGVPCVTCAETRRAWPGPARVGWVGRDGLRRGRSRRRLTRTQPRPPVAGAGGRTDASPWRMKPPADR